MFVLGIESSCDETGVAIFDSERGLLAHELYSQVVTHRRYGGVVPELASRDHIKHLIPLVDKVLEKSELHKNQLDAIAYTAGPGLVGALLTGACFAKSLAFSLKIPSLAVHHLEAHLLAAQLDMPNLEFPFLVLLVSGGHSQIIEARELGQYQILGDTLDDAVGEAFDKIAKIMGIAYPGGPELARLADSFPAEQEPTYIFPRPMTDRPGLDLSFSGLKTHALKAWMQSNQDEKARIAVANAFQTAVVETLVIKCKRALEQTRLSHLVIAGGVGANRALREALHELMLEQNGQLYFPRLEFCADNGAMVAYAGALHLLQGNKDSSFAVEVQARWSLNLGD